MKARYLIKTKDQVLEAENSAQLAHMALMGLIDRDTLIKDREDGRWVRAEEHPDVARLYWTQDTDKTVVGSISSFTTNPAAPDAARPYWVKTDVSTVEVRGLEVFERLIKLGVIRNHHRASHDEEGPFHELTSFPELQPFFAPAVPEKLSAPKLSKATAKPPTLELDLDEDEAAIAEGMAALDPLAAEAPAAPPLSVAEALDRTSDSPLASPEVLAADQDPKEAVNLAPPTTEASALSEETVLLPPPPTNPPPPQEVSVVVALDADELEYLQESSDDSIELLLSADVELIDDELPEAAADEVIALSPDDLEEVESALAPRKTLPMTPRPKIRLIEGAAKLTARIAPTLRELAAEQEETQRFSLSQLRRGKSSKGEASPLGETFPKAWAVFRRTMNAVSRRLAEERERRELTWDLFRSMMETPRPEGQMGPSEVSWRRFKRRVFKKDEASKPRNQKESTWDRFRKLMTHPEQEGDSTWDRFFKAVKTKEEKLELRRGGDLYDAPIQGEAPIKSGVSKIPKEESGPRIQIEKGLT